MVQGVYNMLYNNQSDCQCVPSSCQGKSAQSSVASHVHAEGPMQPCLFACISGAGTAAFGKLLRLDQILHMSSTASLFI
jgi:hypothetical protein